MRNIVKRKRENRGKDWRRMERMNWSEKKKEWWSRKYIKDEIKANEDKTEGRGKM